MSDSPQRPVIRASLLLPFLLLPLLASCRDGLVNPSYWHGTAEEGCLHNVGTPVAGVITRPTAWSADRGPYHVRDTLRVQADLRIEAGTVVCGGPSSMIVVGADSSAQLTAIGTDGDSIVMVPEDSAVSWGGIGVGDYEGGLGGGAHLSHVRLVGAIGGGHWVGNGSVVVDSSTIDGSVATWFGDITMHGTEVHGGLNVSWGGIHADDTRLIGGGVNCFKGSVGLHDVTIEGAGTGIYFPSVPGWGCGLTVTGGVTITGCTTPFFVDASSAFKLLSQPDAKQRLAGNGADTAYIAGGPFAGLQGEVTLWRELPLVADQLILDGNGTLRLEPGATLVIKGGGDYFSEPSLGLSDSVRLDAEGTAAEPVTIIGPGLGLAGLPPSGRLGGGARVEPNIIRHARIDALGLVADSTLLLDSSRVVRGAVDLRGRGSRILDSVLDGGGADYGDSAMVRLRGDSATITSTVVAGAGAAGVRIDGVGASLSRCEVTGSGSDGVVAETAPGLSIHDCDIHDNTGVGVRDLAADSLDATNNWWGDAGGPNGPAGDGVAGPVSYMPFLTSPVQVTPAVPDSTG